MKLLLTLHKGIMNSTPGRLINNFKLRPRLGVLFFEDILAEYIKKVDKKYPDHMYKLGKKWFEKEVYWVLSPTMRLLPPEILINVVFAGVWKNTGTIENIHLQKKENIIVVKTKREIVTRKIGKNSFAIGTFAGLISALYNQNVTVLNSKQSKKECEYTYKLIGRKNNSLKKYKQAKKIKTKGANLNKAISQRIIKIDQNNNLFFRKKSLIYLGHTCFHILGHEKIMLNTLTTISKKFFNEIINKKTSKNQKLILFKNLFQIMGWGQIKIIVHKKEYLIEITSLPTAQGKVIDNFEFIFKVMEGFIQSVNPKFKLTNVKKNKEKYLLTFK